MVEFRVSPRRVRHIGPTALAAACLLLSLLTSPGILAQRYHWQRQFGTDSTLDRIHDMTSSDNGFWAVGWSKSKTTLTSKLYLLNLDADGDTIWTRRIGIADTLDTYGRDVVSTSDGGCMIVGETYRSAERGYDLFLMKITPDGKIGRTVMSGSGLSEYARALVATRDGGFAVVGYTSAGLESENLLIMKADSLGDSLWTSVHSRSYPCRGHALIETDGGALVAVGYSGSWRAPEKTNMLMVMFDDQGREQRAMTYGGEWYEEASAVVRIPGGGFLLAGYTSSFDVEGRDFLVVETDSIGGYRNLKTYGGSADEFAEAMIVDDSGRFYVAGYSNSFGEAGYYYDDYDPCVIHLDADRDSLWAVALESTDTEDYILAAAPASDGWPVIAGYTSILTDEQNENAFVAKLGPNAAPAFANLPDTVRIVEDDNWQMMITVTDADDDAVVFTCEMPENAGITFMDFGDNSALLAFSPTYQNVGRSYRCIIGANDGYVVTLDTIWLEVINRPLQATVYQPGMFSDILTTDTPIPIYFNETVDPVSLSGNVGIFSSRGDSLEYQYDADLNILQVSSPDALFLPLDTIVITLGSGIVDLAGYSLGPPISAEITVGPVVYPGDTDNNGVVDERDILPLGRYWQRTGPVRFADDDIAWDATPAHRWDNVAATYADADGNGIVSAEDICAIAENWLMTWDNRKLDQSGLNTTAMFRQMEQTALEQLYDAVQACGNSAGSEIISRLLVGMIGTHADALPTDFQLYQNYPNPFNPETMIKYYVPSSGEITVSVYNIIGQRVATLVDGCVDQGFGTVEWHGNDQSGNPVASGIYFYRLETAETSLTRRMILIR